MTRPFMASVIFGATSLDQLRNTLGCLEVQIDDDIMARSTISTGHIRCPSDHVSNLKK